MKDFAVKAGLAILVVFAPVKGMLIAALFLIIMDAITGIWASLKRKENFTSTKFKRSVVKILIYEIAIAVAYIAQHYLMNDTIPAANIVAGFIGITELQSVLENLNSISGKNLLKEAISKIAPKDLG